MLGKKSNSSQTSVSESAWLTTFSDMMSLLVVFFVIQISPQAVKSKLETEQKEKLESSIEVLNSFLIQEKIDNQVEIKIEGNKANIILNDSLLFDSGKSVLSKNQSVMIQRIVNILLPIKTTHKIQIEGHTDPIPISNGYFRDNWHLSTERALTVLDIFLKTGFDPRVLSAQGFAHYRPIVSNTNEQGIDNPNGRRKNRRVEFKISGNKKIEVEK